MTSRKTSEIAAALQRKGFRRSESHHTFYILHVQGRKTSIRTKISHGGREYGDPLLAQMGKQLCLSKNDLQRLIDCPLSEEAYVRRLSESGRVRLP
jgi:hypothetical protein